jgi:hypothetical protein
MSEINAAQYARQLFAKGRSFEAVVTAIMAEGRTRNGARMAALRAMRHPNAKPNAPAGCGTGVTMAYKLPAELAESLREAAAKRSVSVHKLASDIMATVVDDSMIDAVLDDQS